MTFSIPNNTKRKILSKLENIKELSSTSSLPEVDVPYIEYSFVIEPESLIVFQEYEYQQVQVMCSHCNDVIIHNNISDYALKARRLRTRRVRNVVLAKKSIIEINLKLSNNIISK